MDFKTYNESVNKNNAKKESEYNREKPKYKEQDSAQKEQTCSSPQDNIRRIYEENKDKSEGELMSDILKEVNKSKANGSYNAAEMDRIYKTVAPMLSDEQKQRLDKIMKMINGSV